MAVLGQSVPVVWNKYVLAPPLSFIIRKRLLAYKLARAETCRVTLVTAAGNVANVTERGTPEPMLPKLPELR